ncbi:D-glycero-beta-D-manno-heptose 1-phosphate adenylyltransferase [Polynucleobacter sp. 30F-ANTBAC]|uniref:D-glycero-beta-D-manno-heptose 1-phosphate adenylyltransferase n=1 Tax=Polynucleobacter sp. 30F-ANTBAC TaxID=2689095 RepID=UPI001C0B505E|nr:D-glycero-beta-D-manno-heptose 1-phosphate adenylyltransferase [Polynucleobacter sp. 30F-ANTBAC]MBU3600135.1 D-glycero-beta-D-manno-heptose 1-phosphate adenylyltransferase [Polynucleobacter sp. 30F-ANTBAC]
MTNVEFPNLSAPSFEVKICSQEDLQEKLSKLPKPIVFTNGVFDLLHRGHVSYLAQARSLGKSLIVGINTDASVRMLGKGDDRPLNAEADRLALLAALESVDLVVLFSEQTPVELIAQIKPDIYVKGGDYQIDTLAETALVKTWGGKAYAIPFIHDRSTTALLRKIRS